MSSTNLLGHAQHLHVYHATITVYNSFVFIILIEVRLKTKRARTPLLAEANLRLAIFTMWLLTLVHILG